MVPPPPRSTLFPYTTLFRSLNGPVVDHPPLDVFGLFRRPRRSHVEAVRHDARARLQLLELRHQLRSEEHTSELQSQSNLVCRLLLEKKNKTWNKTISLVL